MSALSDKGWRGVGVVQFGICTGSTHPLLVSLCLQLGGRQHRVLSPDTLLLLLNPPCTTVKPNLDFSKGGFPSYQ